MNLPDHEGRSKMVSWCPTVTKGSVLAAVPTTTIKKNDKLFRCSIDKQGTSHYLLGGALYLGKGLPFLSSALGRVI